MKRSRLVFLLSLAGTAGFAALTAVACSSSYEVDPEFCTKNPGHAECSPGAGSGGAGGAGNQGSGGTSGSTTGTGGSGGSAGNGNASGAGGTAGAGGSAGVMGQGGSGGVGGSAFKIGSCKIVTPTICSHEDEVPPTIFGQVFVDGVTNKSNAPANRMEAEVGYGPVNTDPRTDLSWSFSKAIPNDAFDFSQDSDEYQVTLPTQSPDGVAGQIQLSYAYRFTLDNAIVAYCDTVGGGEFDPAKAGRWTVTIGVTFCPPDNRIDPSPTRVNARGASP